MYGGKHLVGWEGQCVDIDDVFDDSNVSAAANIVDGSRRSIVKTIREAVREMEQPTEGSEMAIALTVLEFLEHNEARAYVDKAMKERLKKAVDTFEKV